MTQLSEAVPDPRPRADVRRRGSRNRELIRISLYWLGLSSIFAGLSCHPGREAGVHRPRRQGRRGARRCSSISISGAIIAIVVQPTVGSISDYTISRWGRRKPYIFIGSLLDVVFLVGIAIEQHAARHRRVHRAPPVQLELRPGPVPGLRPGPRAGAAGRHRQRARRAHAGARRRDRLRHRRDRGRNRTSTSSDSIALGILELVTMLSVVIRVREGPARQVARRSSVACHRRRGLGHRHPARAKLPVARRRPASAILMGGSVLTSLAVFYLARTHGAERARTPALVFIPLVAARRHRDRRVGRARRPGSPIGSVASASSRRAARSAPSGLAIVASAPSLPVAFLGALLYRDRRPGRSSRSTGRS